MARPNVLLLSLLLIATVSVAAFADNCVYTIYVQTGTLTSAGTDANVSVIISDKSGNNTKIENLETWGGLMGPDHDYFENGDLDIFSGRGACLSSPVCSLTVTSDGTGYQPGWFLNYVEVTTVKAQAECARQHFTMDQWLAVDEPPYDLTVVRNHCGSMESVGPVVV